MLNDLTPAEQRNIEGLKQAAESALSCDAQLTVPQAAVPWVIRACALALAAVPKIEWVETDSPGEEWRAYVYGFELNVSLILNVADEWEYAWAVTSAYEVANQGTAPTLKAAQAAAEAALLKLVRGE